MSFPPPPFADPLDDDGAALLARALAHPVRLRILRILGGRGTCWCGDLCAEFSLAQSTVSQHLKILREAGLVRATPCGTAVGYAADPERLAAFAAWSGTLVDPSPPGWDPGAASRDADECTTASGTSCAGAGA